LYGDKLGLSVVVSSYNYGAYLRDAIDSALAVECDQLQVIVIDDGSTDDSVEIIKSYGDRVETLFQANQGQVASCAAGLARCRNDIVIFLDSDDILEPFAAAEIRALWTPKTVKVQYALQAVDKDGEKVNAIFPKYPHGLTPETIRAELFRAGVYPATTTSGTAFSRHFLEQVMPIPKDYGCDIDDALNAAAPLYGDVQTLRKTLGHYRVHEHNASAHAELTAERFERYANDAVERTRYLRDCCERLGLELDDNVVENDLAYWEARLSAAVLKPAPRLRLRPPALRAAFGSILDPGQRAMHALWATAIAIAPRPLARSLLAQRFIFGRRTRFAEGLLKRVWMAGRLFRRRGREAPTKSAGSKALARLAAAKGNDDARV
jgi:glycosyltransferase involved in cell wall biosynthesis